MNLILKGNEIFSGEHRVGFLNIDGTTAYIDDVAQNVLLTTTDPFPYSGVESLDGKFYLLTHQWPEASDEEKTMLIESVYANDERIALTRLVALDRKAGKMKIEVEMLDSRFDIEVTDYEIDTQMPNMDAEEIVACFYLATENITFDMTLRK